ncbi:hypothetical protein V2J09_017989 [Rumex salicifolius]
MGSEQNRFPLQERWKKWMGCWERVPCFGGQRGGKRIVPAARTPEGNASTNQPNGAQAVGLATSHLLAPPSSPASLTHSAFPSTAQSPTCFPSLTTDSPGDGGPTSTMYATGPYAHETQLVSPPVFSTFTTEPSTAPFTPPPELAHITTPSSPDVPYAQFLSSTLDPKCAGKTCFSKSDLQATYPYSPESPPSSLQSPVSRASGNRLSSSFLDNKLSSHWDNVSPSESTKHPSNLATTSLPRDSNFFCPETFAQFYLDQPSHSGGRLSISKETDIHSNGGGSIHHSRQNQNTMQDVEEIEAYRASFGFSADEIITTAQYVEISDVMDDSFTMLPSISSKLHTEVSKLADEWKHGDRDEFDLKTNLQSDRGTRLEQNEINEEMGHEGRISATGFAGRNAAYASACNDKIQVRGDQVNRQRTRGGNRGGLNDEDDNMGASGGRRRKYELGLSYSDAEVDYRRGQSLRQGRGDFIARVR